MPIHKKWKNNLNTEIKFWNYVMASNGGKWSYDLKDKRSSNSVLERQLSRYCKDGIKNKILDVGAGPLTSIGKKHGDIDFEIIPIDPLADEYNLILEDNDIIPPIRTIKLDGEKLTTMFEENTFDITHARNSIDHSYDPIEIINQMILVTKTGGHIILTHNVRSELYDRFKGLHNWNFFLKHTHFMIRGEFMDTVDINNKFGNEIEMIELHTTIDLINVNVESEFKFTIVFRKK